MVSHKEHKKASRKIAKKAMAQSFYAVFAPLPLIFAPLREISKASL